MRLSSDLIGIKDRKYFDHTATHRNRGVADLMRYAARVTAADSPHFGPFDIVPRTDRRVTYRLSDDALYALAVYIHQHPSNLGGPTRRLMISEDHK